MINPWLIVIYLRYFTMQHQFCHDWHTFHDMNMNQRFRIPDFFWEQQHAATDTCCTFFFRGGDDAMQKVRWITPTRRTDEPNLTHNYENQYLHNIQHLQLGKQKMNRRGVTIFCDYFQLTFKLIVIQTSFWLIILYIRLSINHWFNG